MLVTARFFHLFTRQLLGPVPMLTVSYLGLLKFFPTAEIRRLIWHLPSRRWNRSATVFPSH